MPRHGSKLQNACAPQSIHVHSLSRICTVRSLPAVCTLSFNSFPLDKKDQPLGSNVEFSCTVNADVAMQWHFLRNLRGETTELKQCNDDKSECKSTLIIENVTEDMNHIGIQCIAISQTDGPLYSKAALLTGMSVLMIIFVCIVKRSSIVLKIKAILILV